MNIDFNQFRSQDMGQLMKEAAQLSTDLGLARIEPVSLLIVLNQHHKEELDCYFNSCGVSPEVIYNNIVGVINRYERGGLGNRQLYLSEDLLYGLQIALAAESSVRTLRYPHAAIVTGLLMAPGPLHDLAANLGITSRKMEMALAVPNAAQSQPRTPDQPQNGSRFDNTSQNRTPQQHQSSSQQHASSQQQRTANQQRSAHSLSQKVGLKEEIKRIDDFVRATTELRRQGRNVNIECDTIIMGPSGSGKTWLVDYMVNRLYEANIITRKEPVLVDAVHWSVFENNFGDNMDGISDGVLVVDNVHKLVDVEDINSIGTLDRLFIEMDQRHGHPVVILTGLTDGMAEFIERSPDVKHRFEYIFRLGEYSPEELAQICAQRISEKFDARLDREPMQRLERVFKYLVRNKPEGWAGAHTAIKMADEIYMNMVLRGGNRITVDDIKGNEERDLSPEEIMAQLDDFVGIDNIRSEIRDMISEIQYDQERFGSKPSIRSHFVFTGNPGTGKTTIARVFADVLKSMNVLPIGQLIEADRSQLVSGYVGQTAIQTNKLIDKAIGGVLFIDEAYTLVNDAGSESGFGKEAIDTLLKRLEDDRGKFVCIVAGYTKEMFEFLQSNPGMKSRFNKVIEFKDYNAEELSEIFRRTVAKNNFKLDNSAEACIPSLFNRIYVSRTKNFGNAREVRNIFDEAKKRQGKRLTQLRSQGLYRPDLAFVLTADDIQGEEYAVPVSLEDVLSDMEKEFVGMQAVKDAVRSLGMKIAANQRRVEAGVGNTDNLCVHIRLTGNPGTGKTTVARTLGRMFKAIRILPTDKVIEVDKSQMVGQTVGSTPKMVNELIDRAMGGILFVDEAYTLSQDSDSGNSFGKEAIETLMKRMEDDRGKFICILAGYRTQMDEFMRINPGIKSRITHHIHIEDYTQDELCEIFKGMVRKEKLTLSDEAQSRLHRAVDELVTAKTEDFGNAREMRKLLDLTLDRQSQRLANLGDSASVDMLSTIEGDDIPVAVHKDIDERDTLSKLDDLVGLENVKSEIKRLANYLKLEKMRSEALGKKFVGARDHYLFLGNPGTGKTTVARILADIFLSLGVTKNTNFIETDRSKLVARYVGQTSPQTNRVIDSALGGILFIDEAYTLNQGDHDSFGQEAIDTLLKRMEDDRGKFVCIAAGYSREMQEFIATNSGLQSRFNKIIYFEDYDEAALVEIFKRKIEAEGFIMSAGADMALRMLVSEVYSRRTRNFGNAREINNLFQQVKERQSQRILGDMTDNRYPSQTELLTLKPSDFMIL